MARPSYGPEAQKRSLHLFATLLDYANVLTAEDWTNQRRIAYRLATLQPGYPGAIDCLLQLLLSEESSTHHKRVVET